MASTRRRINLGSGLTGAYALPRTKDVLRNAFFGPTPGVTLDARGWVGAPPPFAGSILSCERGFSNDLPGGDWVADANVFFTTGITGVTGLVFAAGGVLTEPNYGVGGYNWRGTRIWVSNEDGAGGYLRIGRAFSGTDAFVVYNAFNHRLEWRDSANTLTSTIATLASGLRKIEVVGTSTNNAVIRVDDVQVATFGGAYVAGGIVPVAYSGGPMIRRLERTGDFGLVGYQSGYTAAGTGGTASLLTGLNFAGAATSSSTGQASVTTPLTFAGTGAAGSSAQANLSTATKLAGMATSSSTGQATLFIGAAFAGTGVQVTSARASLLAPVTFIGAGAATGSATGAIKAGATFTGAATSSSTGQATIGNALTFAGAATSSSTGQAGLLTGLTFAGAATSSSAGQAAMAARTTFAGTGQVAPAGQGVLVAASTFAGTGQTMTTGVGALDTTTYFAGVAGSASEGWAKLVQAVEFAGTGESTSDSIAALQVLYSTGTAARTAPVVGASRTAPVMGSARYANVLRTERRASPVSGPRRAAVRGGM